MKLLIRADANDIIGSGHMMRCISIADDAARLGLDVLFVTADKISTDFVDDKGYNCFCLQSNYKCLDYETADLIELIKMEQAHFLLIDSYYVTEYYLHKLKKHITTIYIDDLNLFIYPVDILINYTLYHSKFKYESRYAHFNTKFLLGSTYVPLRREFRNVEKFCVKAMPERILLLTGASDNYNISYRVTEAIIAEPTFNNISIDVIIGKYSPYKLMLEKFAEKEKRINLYYNVCDMVTLMKNCDIAITAGGSTLYELCACGVPIVCYSLADNQFDNVYSFDENGIALYAGDVRFVPNFEVCIIEHTIKLVHNQNLRQSMSKKAQNLIDGFGVERILAAIDCY